MAAGTVAVVESNIPRQVGLVARGTALGVVGDSATANVRAASSAPLRLPLTGSRGIHSIGLVVATLAPTGPPPANDFCWAAIEAGFLAGDNVTLRWGVLAACRGIDGPTAADNVVMTQSPYLGAGSPQITGIEILGAATPVHTFTVATGVDNGVFVPLVCDAVRVSFFITHAAAATGAWNLVWRLYAYQA
jgi:hypothetical protein